MAVIHMIGDIPYWIGLSTDVKPDGGLDGRHFYETDTGVTYIYDNTSTWVVMYALGTSEVLSAIEDVTTAVDLTTVAVEVISDSEEVFFFEATGAVAIASTLTLAPASKYQIREFRIHLDAAGGAAGDVNLTITINASAGAAYDMQLHTEDMTLLADAYWRPAIPIALKSGDEIDVAYANAGSATYGLVIVYNKLA